MAGEAAGRRLVKVKLTRHWMVFSLLTYVSMKAVLLQ
jgi:hypothetical protein